MSTVYVKKKNFVTKCSFQMAREIRLINSSKIQKNKSFKVTHHSFGTLHEDPVNPLSSSTEGVVTRL